ncbi:hypothetical protein BH10PSE1_BH10PSE1_18300 [soil metagenome]
MDAKEYLLSLLAILTGLAISDMVVSLHGLLRRFRQVHWDWLPVTAAALIFAVIVNSWWISWNSKWEGMTPVEFMIVLGQLISMFLAAKAILPDDKDEDRLDLLDYYRRTNRYVWTAVSAACLFMIVQAVYGGNPLQDPIGFLLWSAPFFIYSGVALMLTWIQRMTLHRVVVPVLLIINLIESSAQHMTTPL